MDGTDTSVNGLQRSTIGDWNWNYWKTCSFQQELDLTQSKFPPLGSKSKYWACCLSDTDDNDDDIGAAGRVVEFERRFLLEPATAAAVGDETAAANTHRERLFLSFFFLILSKEN